jgi:uncharacterized ParB-like nuclease family protein
MMDEITLSVAAIRTDGGTQPRSTILRDVVEEYAAAMADGAKFPAITVFYDGAEYWLADGFHRMAATEAAGREKINCDVRQGTRRDAVLHSVGANAAHGMRRTNEDKRRAVRVLLEDAEWSRKPDNEIAKLCGVSQPFVGKMRPPPDPSYNGYKIERTVERNGTIYTQNVSNIGSNPPPRPRPDAPVFDSTPSGVANNWTPTDIPATAPALRPARDSSGDYIHHILTEIARQFARLPSATDAADLYPVDLSHALPVNVVNDIADWFSEFAPLWESGHPDRQEWARKIIEKVKETSVVSTQ